MIIKERREELIVLSVYKRLGKIKMEKFFLDLLGRLFCGLFRI